MQTSPVKFIQANKREVDMMSSNITASMRWIARLVLLVISFVWYSPAVYAAVKEMNRPPVMNQIENFYPLGAELEALRKDLFSAQSQPLSQKQLNKRKAKIASLDHQQREQMTGILQHFERRQLSADIIQRQRAANQQHNDSMNALFAAIDAIDLNSADHAQQQAAINAALSHLQQPMSNVPQIYSNNLDFVLPPARSAYKTQAQIDNLIGADNGDYTATDSATQPTQAITDKVTELGSDPLTLYNWVHDTIRWLPSYGVMQGADYTLQAEQGNAFDTASLLIALLREAGHEARYRYGTIEAPLEQVRNWVGDVKNAAAVSNILGQGGIPSAQINFGGAVELIRLEHVWVEVKQGANWYPVDPSFKQYTYTDGMDLQAAVPFDAQGLLTQLETTSTSNEAEGWVQGVDASLIETELADYQTELESYLNTNAPTATLGDVLGLQTINPGTASTLQEAAPTYAIALSTPVDLLPDVLFHRFHFQLGSAVTFNLGASFEWGGELFAINEPTTNLVGKDLAISFRPATQADEDAIASFLPEVINGPEDLPDTLPASSINMVGELTIDGQVVHSTTPITLGTALKTRLGFQPPQGSYRFTENDLDAGQYQAIGIDMQGVSPAQLQALQSKLENTQTQIQADNTASLTKHDVVGDILQAGIQGYMAMTFATDRIAAQSAGVAYYRQPSYGTFSTALSVAYNLGGTPAQVTFTGVVMDVDRIVNNIKEKANCYEGFVAFNRASGMRSSAYEHQIPEQLFSTETEQAEGVSTAKALSIAMAQGQRVYTLTTENANELANITIDTGARSEIQQALNIGLEVTVHQSPINVNGWQGSGYAILDAQYGVGIYQISGGVSGGGSFDLPDEVETALGWLTTVVGTGASVLDTIFEGGPFSAISKAAGVAASAITVVSALGDCGLSDALVVLVPLLLSSIWAVILGPVGIGLLVVFRILITAVLTTLAGQASTAIKDARCN